MGNSTKDRLRAGGITLRTRDANHVLASDIHFPAKGHPLHHPRGDDPIDEEMVCDIMVSQEVREVVTVRDDGTDRGKLRLTIVDGARRSRNCAEAERRLHASGDLDKTAHIFLPVRFFKGSDAEVLKERLRLNADPLKRPDRPSVLAATLIALDKLHEPIDAVVAACPRTVTIKVAKALLSWGNLSADLAAAFDGGAPIGLLPAVLDATPEERAGVLARLREAGIKDPKGATAARNRETGKTTARTSIHPKTLGKIVAALRTIHRDAKTDAVLLGMSIANGTAAEKDIPEPVRLAMIDAGWKAVKS